MGYHSNQLNCISSQEIFKNEIGKSHSNQDEMFLIHGNRYFRYSRNP